MKIEVFFQRYFWLLSFFVLLVSSLFLVFSVYPFIPTADGIKRIMQAQGGGGLNVLPPLQGDIIELFIFLTGGVGLYTFFQIFLFHSSVFILYKALLSKTHLCAVFLLSFFTITFPIFFIFPAILTDSAVVFSSFAIAVALIIRLGVSDLSRRMGVIYLIFSLFFLFLAFGYRLNSLTVLPVILFFCWWALPSYRALYLFGVGAVFFMVVEFNKEYRASSRPEA